MKAASTPDRSARAQPLGSARRTTGRSGVWPAASRSCWAWRCAASRARLSARSRRWSSRSCRVARSSAPAPVGEATAGRVRPRAPAADGARRGVAGRAPRAPAPTGVAAARGAREASGLSGVSLIVPIVPRVPSAGRRAAPWAAEIGNRSRGTAGKTGHRVHAADPVSRKSRGLLASISPAHATGLLTCADTRVCSTSRISTSKSAAFPRHGPRPPQDAVSISRASTAVWEGVRPTFTPTASNASAFAAAVPADPETIAPACPIVLPSGAVNPAM